MTTLAVLAGLLTAFCFATAILAVIVVHLRRDLNDNQHALAVSTDSLLALSKDLTAVATAAFGKQRFEIEIIDWGSDFTGEDGTLPRWRWVVWDADRKVQQALLRRREVSHHFGVTTEQQPGREMPFMLGNERTYREAHEAAMRFIETRKHPEIMVDGDDHSQPPVVVS